MTQSVLAYEQGYAIHVNQPGDSLFYHLDYDERSHELNMEFQHFHDYYEICILLDRTAAHIIEGSLYEIQPYDIVLLRPSLLHKTQYPKGAPPKRLMITFAMPRNTPGLESDYNELFSIFDESIPIFRFTEERRKEVLASINDIFAISQQPSALQKVVIHHRFVEFLCAIHRYSVENGYVREETGSSMARRMYAIASYIHSHYQQDLSLDELSKRFYVSAHHLSRQFNKVTGFTFTEYVQMTRIRNAQQLLLNSREKITDIAAQCGFASFSQFNRIFNKQSGMSPSAYRQSRPSQSERKMMLAGETRVNGAPR
ncbi:AraC family transcriptional regulator [Paenibacillus sp. FSL R5-0766]|uniref:helix-turn-helix transcriptional regulator n=1 Tax=unclassified Paenibacillus TaxID=185978 RepID=UPI00096C5253|nr:AraC family transcriptional regulator [Paenibacillus sp. FSL R5-0765]OMF65958.1 AraC family transcriptional regulator [Paenibacillus sp. FSL R5-0765]